MIYLLEQEQSGRMNLFDLYLLGISVAAGSITVIADNHCFAQASKIPKNVLVLLVAAVCHSCQNMAFSLSVFSPCCLCFLDHKRGLSLRYRQRGNSFLCQRGKQRRFSGFAGSPVPYF